MHITRRSFLAGIVATTAMPNAALAVEYISRDEIQNLVLGKTLKTPYGVWKFQRNGTFTFESRSRKAGPHKWSWSGQDAIKSPGNIYRFYVLNGSIYIKSRGGAWKTQLRA